MSMLLLWLLVAFTKNKDGRSTMPRYDGGARSIAQGLAAVGEWQLWGPLPKTANRSLAICTQNLIASFDIRLLRTLLWTSRTVHLKISESSAPRYA